MTIVAALLTLLPGALIALLLLFLSEFEKFRFLRKSSLIVAFISVALFLILAFYLWEVERNEGFM